jgi:hypothetical protein
MRLPGMARTENMQKLIGIDRPFPIALSRAEGLSRPESARINRKEYYAKQSRENPAFLAKSAIFTLFSKTAPLKTVHLYP